VKRAERTCLMKGESNAYFLVFFCEPVAGKGITKNWDGHNWGYIARKVTRDVMMMGIYGYRDR